MVLTFADSLRYTSALSVALAVVFVVITAGIAALKLLDGSILMPKLFPVITNLASIWNLFTAVPVLVTAFIGDALHSFALFRGYCSVYLKAEPCNPAG